LKAVINACELLTWTNAINVENPLMPVEWGFITFKAPEGAETGN